MASDTALDALFRQNGVIRTDTLEEMLDVAAVLAHQPAPTGNRVGIITNAGGLAVQCADAAEARGLTVPRFSEATSAALARALPPEASTEDPVDMIASAGGAEYAEAIRVVARSGEVDALVVIYIPPMASQAPDVARHIAEAVGSLDRTIPVITAFMSARGVPDELRAGSVGIPSFAFPEQAAIALAHTATYGQWRHRPEGKVVTFEDTRADEAAAILSAALGRAGSWLEPEEVERLLGCYGIRTPATERAASPREREAARRLGGASSSRRSGPCTRRTSAGCASTWSGAEEVSAEAAAMARRLDEAGEPLEGFLVQEEIEGGVEMLVGVAVDPHFGPVVACGAGGVEAELLNDVAVRVSPLTDLDAREMIRSLATYPRLDGYRGAPKADVPGSRGAGPAGQRDGRNAPGDRRDGLQPGDGAAERRRGRRRSGQARAGSTRTRALTGWAAVPDVRGHRSPSGRTEPPDDRGARGRPPLRTASRRRAADPPRSDRLAGELDVRGRRGRGAPPVVLGIPPRRWDRHALGRDRRRP